MPKIKETKSQYRIEAIVQLDKRGQILLPKDLRAGLELEAGDKLALVALEREGKICCVSMFKAEEFTGTVRELLNPIITSIQKED